MPIRFNDVVEYGVNQTQNGEDIHVWVKHRDDRLVRFHWYPSPQAFTIQDARRFFGMTCGMNEDTRDFVVDQIAFTIGPDDPDPAHGLVD